MSKTCATFSEHAVQPGSLHNKCPNLRNIYRSSATNLYRWYGIAGAMVISDFDWDI
jgi:hypothetical protein